MGDLIAKITRNPVIAHFVRAFQRFTTRLGRQFAAAITYFSVLAMVPILMFAFSATGFVLTELRPELLDVVRDRIMEALAGAPDDLTSQITGIIDSVLSNWASIGLAGLLSAMYAGAGWARNLKSAVRAQWRPDFDVSENKRFIVAEVLINFAILLGLLVLIVVTFAIASVSTSLTDQVLGWLGWEQVPGIGILARLVPLIASLVAGWLLFVYLFRVLPQNHVPFKYVARGAIFGAVGLGVLQYVATFLIGTFAGNPATAAFGPVIVLMLFFNIFAQLILFTAAWIATSVQPATANELSDADRPLVDIPESEVQKWQFDEDQPQKPAVDHRSDAEIAWQEQQAREIGPDVWVVPPEPDENVPVNQKVAARAVKVGSVTGWLVGAATGVGLGAAITGLIAKISKRKD